MNDFEQQVRQFIEQEQLVKDRKRLLIACSGGMDSMALLVFFLQQRLADCTLFVAHVDHMLRGEESAADRVFVEQFCKEHDIPCFSTAISIGDIRKEQGGNMQALCRAERYAFFEQMMREHQIDTLVTAHHADDQLESILMALTKAGTITGMQGIQLKRDFANGHIIRPFLMVTKDEIREYLQMKGISFREDPSNAKDTYTRNRFRHHLLPLLKQENRFVSQHATQFSLQLAQDDAYLYQLAYATYDRLVKKTEANCYELEINALLKEPVALQRRLILILLNYIYNEANTFQSHALCTSILKLCHTQNGSAMLNLPKSFIVSREYGKLLFKQQQETTQMTSAKLVMGQWGIYLNRRVYIGHVSILNKQNDHTEQYYLNAKEVQLPLYLRTRLEGDRILLAGMQQAKRLSRLFIDEKVPLHQRDKWPILVDAKGEVLAVIGLRISKKLSKHRRMDDDYVFMIEQVADWHV